MVNRIRITVIERIFRATVPKKNIFSEKAPLGRFSFSISCSFIIVITVHEIKISKN